MRSPTLTLFIGCITLFFPNVALGRLFPLNVWRPPPTARPTSIPSYQPSLRPSLQPSLSPSINPASSSARISRNYMLTSSDGSSSSPFQDWWWIGALSGILILFIGVLLYMDGKRKRSMVSSAEAELEEAAKGSNVPEPPGKNGWFGWIAWPWP